MQCVCEALKQSYVSANTNNRQHKLKAPRAVYGSWRIRQCRISNIVLPNFDSECNRHQKENESTCCLEVGVACEIWPHTTIIHVDKDMAEIGSCHKTWALAKIQLCWWHLRKAVRACLQLNKLSTTPYNVECTRAEFRFISMEFWPSGGADQRESEGGVPGESSTYVIPEDTPSIHGPNSLFIWIPNLSQPRLVLADAVNIINSMSTNVTVANNAPRLTITICPLSATNDNELAESGDKQSNPR